MNVVHARPFIQDGLRITTDANSLETFQIRMTLSTLTTSSFQWCLSMFSLSLSFRIFPASTRMTGLISDFHQGFRRVTGAQRTAFCSVRTPAMGVCSHRLGRTIANTGPPKPQTARITILETADDSILDILLVTLGLQHRNY